MKAVFVIILLVAGSFVACGGNGDGEKEDDLRDTVVEAFQAFIDGENAKFYMFSSSESRDNCPFEDFVGMLLRLKPSLGDISEAEVVIDDVRIEESRGYVDSHIESDGVEIVSSVEDADHFPDYWVLEDGEWKSMTDSPAPCGAESRDDE